MTNDDAILLERLDTARTPDQRAAQLAAFRQFTAALSITAPLPPMGGWRILPDFAALLANHLIEKRPNCIVELGSGISTVLCASATRANGAGHVFSFDHDADFLESTRALLEQHGLSDRVTLAHAPLTPFPLADDRFLWYSIASFSDLPPIDLVVVDGPPQHDNPSPLVRYPALPALFDKLALGATIVLDDADREQERAVIAGWLATYPLLRLETPSTEKGAALLQLRPSSPAAHF